MSLPLLGLVRPRTLLNTVSVWFGLGDIGLSRGSPEAGSVGLAFLAAGDWGGESDTKPTTKAQRAAASGMLRIAKELGANFTLLMGDNFYDSGICALGPTRFRDTFENVYTALTPGHQFYVVAGNHDYGDACGESCDAKLSEQLEYSNKSSHWNYPSLWYKIRREFPVDARQTRVLEILFIDTVVLCGCSGDEDVLENKLRSFARFNDSAVTGEAWTYQRFLAEQQWAWLEESLRSSDADFLWVTGHYPVYSVGPHGSTLCLVERLAPLLEKHGGHYLSGHDHMLSHVAVGRVNMFVVGVGMECCDEIESTVPAGILSFVVAGANGTRSHPPVQVPVFSGFASVNLDAETAAVRLRAHSGDVLYAAPPIPRRWARAPLDGGAAADASAALFEEVGGARGGFSWTSPVVAAWLLLPSAFLCIVAGAVVARFRPKSYSYERARSTSSTDSEDAM